MGYKLENLIGSKFGLLTVKERRPSRQYGSTKKRRWLCLCDCGNETEVDTGQLTSGGTKSCGCLYKISSIENSKKSRHKIAKRDAAFNSVKSIYKSNAAKRSRSWMIDDALAASLLSSNCHYCGQPPSNIYKTTYYEQKYSGIDRLDNSIGYEEFNVVSCCKICNHAKHTMTEEVFMNWLARVFDHQKSKRAMAEIDAKNSP